MLLLLLMIATLSDAQTLMQQSFCKSRKFEQVITHPGCESKTINNHFCYGQCESTYTPTLSGNKTVSADNAIIKCSACRPTDPKYEEVTLKCNDGIPHKRTVAMYKFCQCIHRKCKRITFPNLSDNRARVQPRKQLNKRRRVSGKFAKHEKRSTRRKRRCLLKRSKTKQETCFGRWRQDLEREKKAAQAFSKFFTSKLNDFAKSIR